MITDKERNDLVEKYIPLANNLAWFKFQKTPKNIQLDELKSAAYMGLVDYTSRYSGESLFAPRTRIIGEMKDYLRSISYGKKNDYKAFMPIEFDLSDRKHSNLNEVYEIMSCLDSVHSDIMAMYVLGNWKLKEIANKHNMSIGRVSQILKNSRLKLKKHLESTNLNYGKNTCR